MPAFLRLKAGPIIYTTPLSHKRRATNLSTAALIGYMLVGLLLIVGRGIRSVYRWFGRTELARLIVVWFLIGTAAVIVGYLVAWAATSI